MHKHDKAVFAFKAEYEVLKQRVHATRAERWSTLLRDMRRTANPACTVVRFPNSSSYLFSTGATLWAIDPVYSVWEDYTGEEYEAFAAGMEQFGTVIITHCHSDHLDVRLLRRLIAAGRTRIIITAAIADMFFRLSGLTRNNVIVLDDGAAAEVDGIKITGYAGYHSEPDTEGYPSGSFLVALPDDVTLFFPVDIRDYSLPPPRGLPPIDYLFGHVWLGRGRSHHADFPLADAFCRFMLRFAPAHLVLSHLCEISRDIDSMWLPRHAALIKDRMAGLSPETVVAAPHFGSLLTLEKHLRRDLFVEWPPGARQEMLDNLGVVIGLASFPELMDEAAKHSVPLVEISGRLPEDTSLIAEKITAWRSAGGRILSAHLPEVVPESLNIAGYVAEVEKLVALGIDRATVHPPPCPVAKFNADPGYYFGLYAEALAPLVNAGLTIGVENMHTAAGEPSDERRRFGYLPDECAMFIEGLRRRAGYSKIGFHFDIGHAACNFPFTAALPPGHWIETLGHMINGMHLHQFAAFPTDAAPFPNGHRHICGRSGGYPDLSPIYRGWQSNTFRAHIFLEVRRGVEASPFPSLARLCDQW